MIIVCKDNQWFNSCGTLCELNCENYKNPPKMCFAACVSGCHCKQGYVFKSRSSGDCVLPEECP